MTPLVRSRDQHQLVRASVKTRSNDLSLRKNCSYKARLVTIIPIAKIQYKIQYKILYKILLIGYETQIQIQFVKIT